MAKSLFSVAPAQGTDALFRAWGKGISDALAAVGLVKITTGSPIDWATAAKPATASTAVGYELWKFNDSLQASYPVIIKIEYGGGDAATSPSIWFTVGTTEDGAGALTGLTTVRKQLKAGTNSSTSYGCRVSGATNRVLIAMWVDAPNTNFPMLVNIERTHDAAGADTNEGVLVASNQGNATWAQVAYTFAGGAGTVEATAGALLPSFGTGSTGTAVALYPIFLSKGVFFNPLQNVLLAFNANVTPLVQISFTYYGSTKAFIPISTTGLACNARGAITAAAVIRDE